MVFGWVWGFGSFLVEVRVFVVACLKVDVRGGSKRAVLGMSNAHGPWRGVSNGGGAMMRNYWDGMTNHLLIYMDSI